MAMGGTEITTDVVDIELLSAVTGDPVALSLILDLNAKRPMDRYAYVIAFTSRYNKDSGNPTRVDYVDRMIGALVRRGVLGTTPKPNGEDVYVNSGQRALFRVLGAYAVEAGRVIKKPNGEARPRSQIPNLNLT